MADQAQEQGSENGGSIVGRIIGIFLIALFICFLVYCLGGFGVKEKNVDKAAKTSLKKYVYENFESTTDDIEIETLYSSGDDFIVVGRYRTEIISGCIAMHISTFGGYGATVEEMMQTNEASSNYNYDYSKILEELKAKWEIE